MHHHRKIQGVLLSLTTMNTFVRASAFQAIYRDHLRESALRDDIAGVGHETFPPTRYMIETSSFESFMIIEFTLINLLRVGFTP